MKSKISSFTFICVFTIILLTRVLNVSAEIVVYPVPPGLKTSPDFTMKANDIPIWVERTGSSLNTFNYSLYSGREMEDLNVANFSCSGEITIKITSTANIDSFLIRPKSRNIIAKVNGSEITFTIPGPQKLYIEINGLPHLAIFANPLEVNPPKQGDPGVIYYGPGAHNPGHINLRSNQTIYIAGGAVVYADIRGKNLQNVKIDGRGNLQGNVRISGTSNLNVSGIFIRNTKGWTNTLTDCHKSSYRNVKVFSYEAIYSVDGINPVSCTDFTIDDCFMRCRDDCVAIKSGDIKLRVDSVFVTNCVMVGWACSDGVTIGFELNGGPVENVFIKNCDILYARGGGRTNGHSGFSIVCDGPALVQNIRYEDIRVEEQVEFKNLEFIVTDGTLYGIDPPGHIKGVYLKNIQWENPGKPFIISGYSSDNKVEDITFDHCKAGGKVLTSIADADFRINSFTRNIKIKP
jgi:Glycosyl hydrolases family 28